MTRLLAILVCAFLPLAIVVGALGQIGVVMRLDCQGSVHFQNSAQHFHAHECGHSHDSDTLEGNCDALSNSDCHCLIISLIGDVGDVQPAPNRTQPPLSPLSARAGHGVHNAAPSRPQAESHPFASPSCWLGKNFTRLLLTNVILLI